MPIYARTVLCACIFWFYVLNIVQAASQPAVSLSLSDLVATAGYTNGLPADVSPGPGVGNVFFLRSGSTDTVRSLYVLSTTTGITRKLLDPSDLGPSRAGISSFQLSNDGQELLVPYLSRIFLIRVVDRHLLSFSGDGYIDPVLSPDGKLIAAVKNNDLIVMNVATGRVKEITSGGSGTLSHGLSDTIDRRDFGRTEGFWWSPDSRQIAYVESDTRLVAPIYSVNIDHPDREPTTVRSTLPGGVNATVRLGIVSAAGGATVWAGYNSVAFPYLVRVVWSQQKAPLSIVLFSRDQRRSRLCSVSTTSGVVTTLVEETNASWISSSPDMAHRQSGLSPYWLSDGSGFLWLSEDLGDWQIQVRDRQGTLLREATPSGLHVRSIDDINEKSGVITFEADSDPRQCQIYQTDFRGGPCTPTTHTIGIHSAHFAADHNLYTDTYALGDGEMGTDVFASTTGFRLARLPSLAQTAPAPPNVRFLRVGKNAAYDAAVILPSDFKTQMHYPVLLRVNGGFGANGVTAGTAAYYDSQWYADQGFIVAFVDGSGTPDRGRITETAISNDLLDRPLREQIDALVDIAKQVPQADLTRVSILGEGTGASLAAYAAIERLAIFACAIAVSPVADWRLVDDATAERYLGLPDVNPEAYKLNSVITYAARLQRPILIVQSSTDDYPGFVGSLRLVSALYQTGRPVDFVPVEGSLLPSGSSANQIALHSRILQYLNGQLLP